MLLSLRSKSVSSLDQLRIDGEIRAHEKAVLGALQRHVLQAQLQARDLVGLAVGHQPVVGVAAVVAVLHDAREIVDGGGVLHGLAGAHELRDAVGIEAAEAADGGLGDDDARRS